MNDEASDMTWMVMSADCVLSWCEFGDDGKRERLLLSGVRTAVFVSHVSETSSIPQVKNASCDHGRTEAFRSRTSGPVGVLTESRT